MCAEQREIMVKLHGISTELLPLNLSVFSLVEELVGVGGGGGGGGGEDDFGWEKYVLMEDSCLYPAINNSTLQMRNDLDLDHY